MYGWVDNLPLSRLKVIILKAWKAITPNILDELISEMRDRCQAVITAQGGHTKY